MYFGFDMPRIQKRSDRNQYFMFFIIGCVTSACIIAPLLVVYSPSSKQTVLNEEKCKYYPCLNNGHCIMFNGSNFCICPEGFLGTSCQIQDECISSVPCHNEGTCITTENSSYCICTDGYLGKNCEYRVFNPRQRKSTLYLSSRKHGHCDIIYPSFEQTKTLTLEGKYVTFDLSDKYDFTNHSENSDVYVRIFCDVLSTLFHFVRDRYCSIWESYIVIPSALLSTQYVVPKYKTQQKFDALGIIAIEEDTQINVSFTSARWILSNITYRQSIYHKSQLLSFTTDPYVYNFISCDECYLTGTYITSTYPVAVMFKSSIPEVVPVLPYKEFSRQFIVPKLQAEIKTMGLRIYAHTRTRLELKDDNNIVSTSVINANNYHNTNHKNTTAITADKDILLFLKIYSPHTGTIDVTVPSDTQYLPEYQFIIPKGTMKNIATFIVKLGFSQGVRLNNNVIKYDEFRQKMKFQFKNPCIPDFLGQCYNRMAHSSSYWTCAVWNFNSRFSNIVVRWPGSTHDSFMLTNSSVPVYMDQIPNSWLLGESGYPLKKWLMTPLLHTANDQEVRFNNAHCKTRNVIERSFGVLKSRFRCLHKTGGHLPYKPPKSVKIISSCFKLHNKCIDDGVPLLNIEDGGNEVEIEHHIDIPANHNRDAQTIRQRLVNRF